MPHFHAIYGDHSGVFTIDNLNMIEGDLLERATRMVRDWANPIKTHMWEKQEFRRLPGLE